MHPLQTHVLKTLTTMGKARYADLKPKQVDGNLFTYHLKKVVDSGYVYKRGASYHLTAAGKRYADRTNLETFRARLQPKIVTMLVVQNRRGEYLFFTRHKQPFKGRVGFPYGKMHLEERVYDAAVRELREKTGLSAKLVHRGDVYLHICDEEELITHMLCHVFEGTQPKGALSASGGECAWEKLEDVDEALLFPGTKRIAKLLKTARERFFEEYSLNTTEHF